MLDEKIIQRTEEVPDPHTGVPTIQTFEYVEKVIEREVSAKTKLIRKICIFIRKKNVVNELLFAFSHFNVAFFMLACLYIHMMHNISAMSCFIYM